MLQFQRHTIHVLILAVNKSQLNYHTQHMPRQQENYTSLHKKIGAKKCHV